MNETNNMVTPTPGKKGRYQLADLEVTEFIIVEDARWWNSASSWASQYGQQSGKKFSCPKVEMDGRTVMKITRIS